MAQAAAQVQEKRDGYGDYPHLRAFREKVSSSQFEYWISKSTDSKGGNSDLEVLLGEYERLRLEPMSGMIVLNMRKNNNTLKPVLTTTLAALLVLCERDPNWGSLREGEIVMSEDGKSVISAKAYASRRNSNLEFSATAYYVEAVQKAYDGSVKGPWKDRPRGMTMKCAKTAVLKIAFPTACAGMDTEFDSDSAYDEHNLPPAAPLTGSSAPMALPPARAVANRTMIVDTETGEAFEARTPDAPPAQPQAATHALNAASHIGQPPESTTAANAAETPNPANDRKATNKAFNELASDSVRKALVAEVYELAQLNAKEVDDARHRMMLRVVAGAVGLADIPERWVDFEVPQLGKYLDLMRKPADEAPKPAPEPLQVEEPDRQATFRETIPFADMVKKGHASLQQIQQFVFKLTDGRTDNYNEIFKSEADRGTVILQEWVTQKRAQTKAASARA